MTRTYDEYLEMDLKELAKVARLKIGMTQTNFARAIGMSPSSISWWETGMSNGGGASRVLLEIVASGNEGAANHLKERLYRALREEYEAKQSAGG